jgi:hypothetical protein
VLKCSESESGPTEVTSLEYSYARRIRDDTAESTTNVAEDHSGVLQAALELVHKRVTDHDATRARREGKSHT